MPSPTPVEYRSKRDPATPGVGEALRVRSGCSGGRRTDPDRDLGDRRRQPNALGRDCARHIRSASLPPARTVRRAARRRRGRSRSHSGRPERRLQHGHHGRADPARRLGGGLARRPAPGSYCAGGHSRCRLDGLHPRAGRSADGVDLAHLHAHRRLRDLDRGRKAFGASARSQRSGRGGPRRRRGEPSRTSGTGSRASCTTCSRTRSV